MSGHFGDSAEIPAASTAAGQDADSENTPVTPLIDRVASEGTPGDRSALGWLRPPDAVTGPFGAVNERDQYSRPLHIETARVNFKVGYGNDGEIDSIAWKPAQPGQTGVVWQRDQSTGLYDMGNGEKGKNLRIDARSGSLTWQNENGQLCCQYPDGDRFVEGANRARKAAIANA